MPSVLWEKDGPVGLMTFNRPEALNSFDDDLLSGALACLEAAGADPELRVLILTGAGRAFCAGGDVAHLQKLPDEAAVSQFIKRTGELAARLHRFPRPVIARVNGVAAGAGANLALACDLIVAGTSARFGQSFARVGLIPDAGGHCFLPRAVGLAKAKELMFTGALLGAEEARSLGLVNRVAPDGQLAESTLALAREIAAGPPLALARIKENLNLSFGLTLEQMLARETEGQVAALMSRDGREGLRAFGERRPPLFTGE
ncbi:MAG: enoyl-CoA hydratase/isomerase family protein [Candidatus Adiutrix sp.]|jgi:2-(1,2-epoxy-1,2-dihydrophenyl)acetyl-CoA isomerase|nr:enoyl-CoA hydratase/isomerase family protein [Candidatus Adiutrix sp.]